MLIDTAHIEKATRSLKKHAESRTQPIYLQITLKGQLVDKRTFIPVLIRVPNSLYKPLDVCSICVIVRDPQAIYQQALEDDKTSSTRGLFSEIISLSKLKSRLRHEKNTHTNFLDSYDLILVEDKVASLLPPIIGSRFYKSGRIPVPVAMSSPQSLLKRGPVKNKATSGNDTAKSIKTEKMRSSIDAELLKKQVHRIHNCASLSIGSGTLLSIPVGYCSMSTEELVKNIEAVLELVSIEVLKTHKGWKFVEKAHIKTPESVALPLMSAEKQ